MNDYIADVQYKIYSLNLQEKVLKNQRKARKKSRFR